MTDQANDIVAQLKKACNGWPNARIPWPHRVLHDAIEEIETLRLDRDRWKKHYEDERLSKMYASYDPFGDHR